MRRSFVAIVIAVGLSCAGGALGAEPAKDPGWFAKAEEAIAAREYHVSAGEAGLQAPNRAQDLRTHFGPQGIRLAGRTSTNDAALVEMRVLGVGRGRRLTAVPAGEVVSDGARVEIRRPGLVEWYENKPEGLEQGFTVARRPSGKGELRVALSLGAASVRRDGDGLVLMSASGRELKYGGLVVRDARGKIMPSRFELPGLAQVEIAVNDKGAAYPLVVDPLFSALFPPIPDQTLSVLDNSFGASVAGNCDVNADGYADLIVGAPAYESAPGEGAAFVYHGGPTGIGAPIKAMLHLGQAYAYFGMSVACAGKTNHDRFDDVIVGAPKYDASLAAANEGAAFVFEGGPAGVDAPPDAVIVSDQLFALLGASVAGAGDVNADGYDDVIVGAGQYDTLARDGSALLEDGGAAFVFMGGPSGVGSATSAEASAKLATDKGKAYMGGAYRYLWNTENWGLGIRGGVAGAGDVNGDGFDDVIVGAPGYDSIGAAFVYLGGRQGIASEPDATLHGQGSPTFMQLGYDVAAAGDVNGDGYDDVIVGGEGSYVAEALIFHGGSGGIASGGVASAASHLIIGNEGFGGIEVASGGDVNNDGYDDVVVGGFGDGSLQAANGQVYLGTATGVPSWVFVAPYTYPGSKYQLELDSGWRPSVAGAGDVNGDGYDDVILGLTTPNTWMAQLGVVRVYHGGPKPGQPVIGTVP